MTMPAPCRPARRNSPRRLAGFATFVALAAGVALLSARSEPRLSAADPPAGGKPKETLVGGLPLWSGWPNKKPDAVIVFSGQTFGYLQPCGCSRPQTGGLERRAVLVERLKAKGWPVVGVDLGDLYAEKPALSEQGKLKYVASMNALREMGYLGVGLGRTELSNDLFNILSSYALQKEQRPFMLAANAGGVANGKAIPREQIFPIPAGFKHALVESAEVGKAGAVAVGVAGLVGGAMRDENAKKKWDTSIDFPDGKKALEAAVKQLAKQPLKVLIYQGPLDDAEKVAKDFPQFQAILCQSETDLPPQQPGAVQHKDGTRTLLITVGHRGQYVGVLGAFAKTGGFDFHYQLVPLGEEFITPGTEAEALKANKALQALEAYAKAVKDAKLLPQYPRVPHQAQIQANGLKPPVKLSYVGSAACKACHAAEYTKWTQASHSHAMQTLEKVATRPSLRQFDGECVVCHSVGFKYQDGYIDDQKTPHLRDVGCENCHGPGSGHAAAPKNKDLLAYLSPWKQQPGAAAKLPDAAFMKKLADTTDPQERGKIAIQPAHQLIIQAVERKCMECHDHDADPKFDIYKSWPKIDHSGLAPKGGWPAVAPKPPVPQPAPKK